MSVAEYVWGIRYLSIILAAEMLIWEVNMWSSNGVLSISFLAVLRNTEHRENSEQQIEGVIGCNSLMIHACNSFRVHSGLYIYNIRHYRQLIHRTGYAPFCLFVSVR